MKKLIVIMLMMYLPSFAQDSLSTEFMRLYNEYRVKNQLPPLEYDMQLDSLCLDRLIVASAGISDCFVSIEKIDPCPDGRNQHFKFSKTAEKFNNANNGITLTGENMVVTGEFDVWEDYIYPERTFFEKIWRFFRRILGIKSNHKTPPTYTMGKYRPVANPAKSFLDSWISSPGHNRYLLYDKNTHFAFRIYRTMHYGRPYLHGVFLGGIKKNSLSSK